MFIQKCNPRDDSNDLFPPQTFLVKTELSGPPLLWCQFSGSFQTNCAISGLQIFKFASLFSRSCLPEEDEPDFGHWLEKKYAVYKTSYQALRIWWGIQISGISQAKVSIDQNNPSGTLSLSVSFSHLIICSFVHFTLFFFFLVWPERQKAGEDGGTSSSVILFLRLDAFIDSAWAASLLSEQPLNHIPSVLHPCHTHCVVCICVWLWLIFIFFMAAFVFCVCGVICSLPLDKDPKWRAWF